MAKSMQPGQRETSGTFNIGQAASEDSFTGQDSQNPLSARRNLSFIPSVSGELARELGQAKYLPTQIAATIGALCDYAFNNVDGSRNSVRFASASAGPGVFALYKEVAGSWVLQSLPLPSGFNSNAPFNNYPQFCIINNLLHLADGTNSWIYDGPNGVFVQDGFPIPPVPFSIGLPSVAAGVLTVTVGLYYWATYADHTAGRVHESSTSIISAKSTALAAQSQNLQIMTDTVDTTIGSPNVSSHNNFHPWGSAAGAPQMLMLGMTLYVNGVNFGPIIAVTDADHIVLANNAPATISAGFQLVVPRRTTHVHIYRSESDGSKLGKFLTQIAVTANPPTWNDNSPLFADPASTQTNIDRPIRNDPPAPSAIVEAHKYRIFRRREVKPNFIFFSGNEEIVAGNGNGSPQESYPGAAGTLTLSDLVDEFSYPQPANRVRALCSHADALWIGTESGITPLYGNSIDDFGIMQIVTVPGGALSRWSLRSTGHGLVIFGYDRLLNLYPPISPVYNVTSQADVTEQLVEIGRAMRKKFLAIKSADQDNVRTLHYKYNSRDWLVVCMQDNASVYHTYVYDFTTKSWFESQRGFASVAVFEPTAGTQILVGGGTDGFVYVMDDLSGTFTLATCPAAQFRTALISFGRPDTLHEPESLEYELSNPALGDDVTVNFYLDPQDADNPGTPIGPMLMALVPNSATRYRGYFAATNGGTGVTCKRLMVELNVAASSNAGALRGIMLKSVPVDEEAI